MEITNEFQLKTELNNILQEVDSNETLLNQYELTKDKKIISEVTSNMKKIASRLRELSPSPFCKTKENFPLLQQLSSKMQVNDI